MDAPEWLASGTMGELMRLRAEVVRLQAEVDRQLKDALDWRHRYGREVIAREALEAENARLRTEARQALETAIHAHNGYVGSWRPSTVPERSSGAPAGLSDETEQP